MSAFCMPAWRPMGNEPACLLSLNRAAVISHCKAPPPTWADFPSLLIVVLFNLRRLIWMPSCSLANDVGHPCVPDTAKKGVFFLFAYLIYKLISENRCTRQKGK